VSRVKESNSILTGLGAVVTEKIYPGIPHTIIQDEIDWVNNYLLRSSE
jgi:phospholipase/carboxylesterase